MLSLCSSGPWDSALPSPPTRRAGTQTRENTGSTHCYYGDSIRQARGRPFPSLYSRQGEKQVVRLSLLCVTDPQEGQATRGVEWRHWPPATHVPRARITSNANASQH